MHLESHEAAEKPPIEIFLKRQLFEVVASGAKDREIRTKIGIFANLKVGDCVIFKSGSGEEVRVKITAIRKYASIDIALSFENTEKLAPGFSRQQIQEIIPEIFPNQKAVKQHGVIVFEFEKVE